MTEAKNVFACINGSQYDDAVCQYAAWFAKQADVSVRLQHNAARAQHSQSHDLSGTLTGTGQLLQSLSSVDLQQQLVLTQRGRTLLKNAQLLLQSCGVAHPDLKLRSERFIEDMVSQQVLASLIIVGASAREWIEQLARQVQAPILLCRQNYHTPERVALVYDDLMTGEAMLTWLKDSPFLQNTQIHFFTPDTQNPDFINSCRALRLNGRVVYPALLARRASAEQIQSLATSLDCQLIATASFRRSAAFHWLFGSSTKRLLAKSKLPVLLLR